MAKPAFANPVSKGGLEREVPSMFFRVAVGAFCFLVSAEADAEQPPLADLIAVQPTDAGINVTVPTGGCTKKADFEVTAHQASQAEAKIEIRRLKRDDCKGNFPDGLKLSFTWDDLKLPAGTKLTVANPGANAPVEATTARAVSVKKHKKLKKRCKRSKAGKRYCKAGSTKHASHRPARRAHRHRVHCHRSPGS